MSDTLGGRGYTAATRRYRGLSARRREPRPPSRRRLRGLAKRFRCPRPATPSSSRTGWKSCWPAWAPRSTRSAAVSRWTTPRSRSPPRGHL